MADTNLLSFDGPLPDVRLSARAYTVLRFVGGETQHAFDLHPPYQRGSAWSKMKQQNLIRSMLMGVPFGSLTINEREFGTARKPYAIIDGKQRIETVRSFTGSSLVIPAIWLRDQFIVDTEQVDGWPVPGVRFESTTPEFRLWFINLPMPANESRVATVEEEAEIYRLINSGGVEQTEADLARAAAVENGGHP